MEQMIVNILEKSLVGGAFIYLLHYFVNKNGVIMENISKSLERVSETLLKMDIRLDKLEQEVRELKEEK